MTTPVGKIFADGTCSSEKGKALERRSLWERNKLMVVVDGQGMPIGLKLTSATPHESTLINTLDTIRVPRKGKGRPRKRFPRLIYDRAPTDTSFVTD